MQLATAYRWWVCSPGWILKFSIDRNLDLDYIDKKVWVPCKTGVRRLASTSSKRNKWNRLNK